MAHKVSGLSRNGPQDFECGELGYKCSAILNLNTIVVKSCWEGCMHHFNSHLDCNFDYSSYMYLLYYLAITMLLCPPPLPHVQCWEFFLQEKSRSFFPPGKSNIDRGGGGLSLKYMYATFPILLSMVVEFPEVHE